MTIKIRQSVFETNSSSTHSICIAKEAELDIPKCLHFSFGEFGWECDTLYSLREKASYLYTGLIANGRQDDFMAIVAVLEEAGIEVSFEEPVFTNHKDGTPKSYADNEGYVDHSDKLVDFLDALVSDAGRLKRFLFSGLSFIITGNDNDDSDVDIKVEYAYEGYYKGN